MLAVSLRVENLHFGYPEVDVLDGVDFEVKRGQLCVIIGANGSGKSTTLMLIAGFLEPKEGKIIFEFENNTVTDRYQRLKMIGYLSPHVGLYPVMSVRENLEFICSLKGISSEEAIFIVSEFGVPLNRSFSKLSSGMVQKVKWALALANLPPVLLLDEPWQNMDKEGIEISSNFLKGYLSKGGIAVVTTPLDTDFLDCDVKVFL